jgi:hypothetical protein
MNVVLWDWHSHGIARKRLRMLEDSFLEIQSIGV